MDMLPFDLVVDVGNTRLKAARYRAGRLEALEAYAHNDLAGLERFLAGERPRAISLGSVAQASPALIAFLEQRAPLLMVTGATPAPVTNGYATPATLGVDRLANAAGAWALFPGRPALAIDAGTCVTYDLVDERGVFLGGAITPGLRMRAKAMHAYSAHLPEVDPPERTPLIGTDTTTSIASGIQHGMLLEMQGYIAALRQQYPHLAVVLTGGDALRFTRALKNGIFAHPSLTLFGLYAILQHHFPPGSPAATGPADGRPGPGLG